MTSDLSGGMRALSYAMVGDLPPRPHPSVDVTDPIWRVLAEMKQQGRGAVLVEDDGKLVGIFTERDLVTRVDHLDPLGTHIVVGDVMTAHPTIAHPFDSLAEALRLLLQGRRRHLPIVDERGRTLGLLSIRDILTYVAGRFPEDMMNLPPSPDHES